MGLSRLTLSRKGWQTSGKLGTYAIKDGPPKKAVITITTKSKRTMKNLIDYLNYILKCDNELWENDELSSPVYLYALENEYVDIIEKQEDANGWFDPNAYVERYATVSNKGLELIKLAKETEDLPSRFSK
jgi:hypothetical protein